MTERPETSHQYPANGGFKITGDPAYVIRERGGIGGLATRNLPSGATHQPSGDRPTRIGAFLANKYVCKVDYSGGQRTVKRIYDSKKCCSTDICKVPRCKTCTSVDKSNFFVSPITGTGYSASDNADCKSRNVIYLLSCKKCSIQYVGETTQSLRERFGQHRNNVAKNNKKTLMVRHFNSEGHSVPDMSIRVLECLPVCDKQLVKAKLTEAEDFWIRQLVSAYPFGLNDRIKGYGLAEDIFDPTTFKSAPFFCSPPPNRNRGHGRHKRRSRKRLNPNLEAELELLLRDSSKPVGIRSLIVYLRGQSRVTLAKCNNLTRGNLRDMPIFTRVIVLAFFSGYFAKAKPKSESKVQFYRLCAEFPNKGMEIIEFQNIFKDRKFVNIIPFEKRKEVKPVSVVYKYLPPFSRMLCNYSAYLRDVSKGGPSSLLATCECADSPFVYELVGHVITGDLSIIKDVSLRDIFAKGAKYRVPKPIDREEVEQASITAIVSYTQYLIRKKIIFSEQAIKMQERFMQIVRSRIAKHLNQGHGVRIVDEAHLRTELRKVHSKYVVCPADKASNNYVVVCRVLYLKILCEELGVTCENGRLVGKGNSTYAFADEEVGDILARHARVAQGYGLTVSDKDNKLPHMFAIPKLHKSPFAWRFISGARKSSMKALSLRLHVILSSFKRHFRNYCKVIETRTGLSYYWSVDNSIVVKDRLVASFAGKNLNSFISADFSTLFTALPHKTIERCLFALTDKCFNNSGKPYICVEKEKVFFVEDSQKHAGECYWREQVKQLITDVIGQTYVQFAGLILRQTNVEYQWGIIPQAILQI